MKIKYAPLKKVKDVINQDAIADVMKTGRKICRIHYKVLHGVLVMVSSDSVVKTEIDKTIEIIQQLMKDTKKKSNFDYSCIFTYTIPTLTDAV